MTHIVWLEIERGTKFSFGYWKFWWVSFSFDFIFKSLRIDH